MRKNLKRLTSMALALNFVRVGISGYSLCRVGQHQHACRGNRKSLLPPRGKKLC